MLGVNAAAVAAMIPIKKSHLHVNGMSLALSGMGDKTKPYKTIHIQTINNPTIKYLYTKK